ncbi:hypothetical protein L1987_74087 [Smallanthus sonchifolius]|uniref:Uncharacterized protein n=1 Tax=Smallanthus sonchifolius TaxID=185202 RepID=A0ACB9A2D9_9ASTR|nr:hypothetical protein L1987_74087 [Smallanthus sonchifolius]
MGKLFAFYSAFILFLLVEKVVCRHLQNNGAELVSDGGQESSLHLKGIDDSEGQCKLMYGFLPCSTNIPSHIFLIVVYEYLLYHAESYAGGDGHIIRVFGENFFVSIAPQLLDSLPDSLILLGESDTLEIDHIINLEESEEKDPGSPTSVDSTHRDF